MGEQVEQTPEQRREIAVRNIAKYFCVIVGIEPVDSLDGSPNWWIFNKEAEEIVDGLLKRFPPATRTVPNNRTGADEQRGGPQAKAR
jgi:hypothetical protein